MNPLLRESVAHVFVDDVSHPLLHTDDLHHLGKSLRLRDGESVTACDGNGHWRVCAWRTTELLEVVGEVHQEQRENPEVAIALAVVKGDRTDFAVEKMTEIGIDHIIILSPVQRSVVRWDDDKTRSNIKRLTRIAHAASMQSRRVFLPRISGPVDLQSILALANCGVAEPWGTDDVAACEVVVVGPEGGFAPQEIEGAPQRVGLGDGVLRAETAAIVATTLMVAHRARRSDHTG